MNSTDIQKIDSEQGLRSKKIVTDFGIRKFYRTATSPAICLPKVAVDNCILESKKARVLLVDEEDERYIKLVPISNENGGEPQ